MHLHAVLLSAYVATLCTARDIQVEDVLDLDPVTCEYSNLDAVFDQTHSLYDDCLARFGTLEAGMEHVKDDGWQRNVST